MMFLGYYGQPRDEEILTPTTSTGFTAAKLNPSTLGGAPMKCALVTAISGDIRFDLIGNTPDTTSHLIKEGDTFPVLGVDACRGFKCIVDQTSSGAQLRCTYFY